MLQVRIITLKFNTVLENFDDGPFQDFIKDKELISVREHFFIRNHVPYISLVITCRAAETVIRGVEPGTRKIDESWRNMISEEELPLFDTFRNWRSERAKKDGIPVFVICNNTELAHIVKARPKTLHALQNIRGFGRKKAEKYGPDIIKILSSEQHTGISDKTADPEKPQNEINKQSPLPIAGDNNEIK